MNKRAHIYYSGTVQGVGFRFTVDRYAHRLGISGWVKNLFDGRVELVAEGRGDALGEFLKSITEGPLKDYIHSADVSWSEPTGEFTGFEIRFW